MTNKLTFPKLLNKRAQAIFHKLIRGLNAPGDHNTIGDGEPYMSVHLDFLRTIDNGSFAGSRVFAVAHRFVQNGDSCADPDMEFLVTATNAVMPMTFQQDIPPVYQQVLRVSDDGNRLEFADRAQASITEFANQWLVNIEDQQDLDAQ